MDYLPINLNITNQNCLVVGGGNIALRKSKQLLKAGAALSVVAPLFHEEFKKLAFKNELVLIESHYQLAYLKDQLLVIAATDDLNVNQIVFDDAKENNVLVNVVDQTDLCQFIMPSVIDRTPLTIAISSGGTAPVLARMLREKFEWLLPNNIGEFLFKLKGERKRVSEKYPNMAQRRMFWEHYFETLLKWSSSNQVANETPRELDAVNPIEFNLNNEKTANDQFQNITSQLILIKISKEFQTIDDLTINNIKALQKADDVYLTEKFYKLFENIIRRDADIHILRAEMLSEQVESIRAEQQASQNINQLVIIQTR